MNSRHYALISVALYVVLLVLAFLYVGITPTLPPAPKNDVIYIEMEKPEPEKPKEKPKPKPKPVKKIKEAPIHDNPSTRDNHQQVDGKAEKTRTIDPKTKFKMPKQGIDKPTDMMSNRGEKDSVITASGKGGGANTLGNIELDEGLQGRGLIGSLPKPPSTNVTKSGKVVVRVTVDQTGKVTNASFVLKGSTIQDKKLVDDVLKAARKARFAESKAFTQGGEITYIFRVE